MTVLDQVVEYKWKNEAAGARFADDSWLHLWIPEWISCTLPMIHSHNFYFHSRIIIGYLRAKEFRYKLNPEGEWLYCSGSTQTSCDVIPIGERVVKQGEEYEFGGIDVFHQVYPPTHVLLTHMTRLDKKCDKHSGVIFPKATITLDQPMTEPPDLAEIEEKFKMCFAS